MNRPWTKATCRRQSCYAGNGREVGRTTDTKCRVRYADKRVAGLDEIKRILRVLDRPPPEGRARWDGPLIAQAHGYGDLQYVWRFLQRAAKAADVVGLYMAPPENAIVI
jgi:hypothetical protein